MYLFLVRHFNDIDHITPIAWKMKKDGYPVAVYCMNPRYDIANDYRLEFMKSKGVVVDYIHTAYRRGDPLYKFLQRLMKKSFGSQASVRTHNCRLAKISSKVFEQMDRIAGKLAYKLMRKMYYHTRWAQSILEQTAAMVVFWRRFSVHACEGTINLAETCAKLQTLQRCKVRHRHCSAVSIKHSCVRRNSGNWLGCV